jgi:hypothetical protein
VATVAEALAPLLGDRDAAGEFIFPLPPSARVDTLLLGCTHYPLLRPIVAQAAGPSIAIVDSATATASALAELLTVNGLEAPGTTRGTAADAGAAGHERPVERLATPCRRTAVHDRRRRAVPIPGRAACSGRIPACRVDRSGGRRAMTGRSRGAAAGPWRDDRVWQAGFLIGAAVGAAATVLGRDAEHAARQGLVDWAQRSSGSPCARLRSARALSPAELRAAEPAYRDAMARIVPALSAALGTELPGVVERAGVVDRAGWVRANTATFASLIGRLEGSSSTR